MIRFLIVLECFLIALLLFSRILAMPGTNGFPADEMTTSAGLRESDARTIGSTAAASPEVAVVVRGGRTTLSEEDRAAMASDLLGLPNVGSTAHTAPKTTSADQEVAANLQTVPVASALEETLQQPSRAMVVDAQRLLRRLGYSPGPADGVIGERTRRAIDNYRRRKGLARDGMLSEQLVAQLRRDARRVTQRAERRKTTPGRPPSEQTPSPNWLASVAGGLQRLVGQEFDSTRQPDRLREYCRLNRDNWIYDKGQRALTYCGRVAAAL